MKKYLLLLPVVVICIFLGCDRRGYFTEKLTNEAVTRCADHDGLVYGEYDTDNHLISHCKNGDVITSHFKEKE
jgi:hypothetical protein